MSDTAPAARGPWGPWVTAALGAVTLIAFYAAQLWTLTTMHADRATTATPGTSPLLDGLVLSVAILVGAAVCSALVFLFIWLRRGPGLRDYVALVPVTLRVLLLWLGIQLALTAAWDVLTWGIGREIIPPFLRDAYVNVDARPLLFIAVVAAAPFFEEIFFRGFLLEGLRRSKLGAIGAVCITSAVWALVHLQYEAYEMASIFLLGLVFGYARLRTGSLLTPMAMHALANAVVLVQIAFIAA